VDGTWWIVKYIKQPAGVLEKVEILNFHDLPGFRLDHYLKIHFILCRFLQKQLFQLQYRMDWIRLGDYPFWHGTWQ
jgi:hypothetical protein